VHAISMAWHIWVAFEDPSRDNESQLWILKQKNPDASNPGAATDKIPELQAMLTELRQQPHDTTLGCNDCFIKSAWKL